MSGKAIGTRCRRDARTRRRRVRLPKTIRVDKGPEFVSKELDLWAYLNGVTLDLNRPGKPTDNAFIGSFNGKFRAEGLNANWFMSLDEARRKCVVWRRDCLLFSLSHFWGALQYGVDRILGVTASAGESGNTAVSRTSPNCFNSASRFSLCDLTGRFNREFGPVSKSSVVNTLP